MANFKDRMCRHRGLTSFFLITVFCIALMVSFRLSPAFSRWFAMGPAAFFRILLGAFSSIFPFSLFETLVAAFVLYLLFLLAWGAVCLVKKIRGKSVGKRNLNYLLAVPVILLSVVNLFALTFASSYSRFSVAWEMGLDLEGVDREAVFFALESLCDVVNEVAPQIPVDEKGESVAPDLRQVMSSVRNAAGAFGEKNGFYQSDGFPAKTFLSSPWMTYTHISGVYGFFTGEANVNTNYPHFIVTATLSHETAHARGIAPENECNFLAAVVLLESEDPYLRYCGASFVADDLMTVCNALDPARTQAILKDTHPLLFRDWAAYSRFFQPYRDSVAAKVADKTNSAYLQSMGQEEGTVSYSRIIRLVSAYFSKEAH